MIQEHNSDKVVALSVRATKVTEEVLKNTIRQFLAYQKNKKQIKKNDRLANTYKGKQSVKQLIKGSGNNQLTNIEITEQNIKSFNKVASKYGIDYALKKDKTVDPPKYLVFFKAKDYDVMTAAFKHFLNEEVNKSKKPSIRKRLKRLRERVNTKQYERTRKKVKTREAER